MSQRLHRSRPFGPAIVLLSVGLFADILQAAEPVRNELASPEGEIDIVGPVRPGEASKALQDTVWIADWSFDAAGGGCIDAGWIKYDNRILNTHVDSDFWHVDNRFDGLTDGAKIGRAHV